MAQRDSSPTSSTRQLGRGYVLRHCRTDDGRRGVVGAAMSSQVLPEFSGTGGARKTKLLAGNATSAPIIIEKLPFEKYIELPGEHSTSLRAMLTSPLAYWRQKQVQRDDTDAFRVGRAGHTAILEPDRFMLEYAVWRGARRAGAKWTDFQAHHAGQTILTVKQYELALRLRDAARAHKAAKRLLDEPGRHELTLCWTHERTGLRCKARVDRLCSAVVDIKSTKNPVPTKFSSDAARYGYPFQLSFYASGVAAVLGQMLPQKIIAVQSSEPHDVVVYDVPEATQVTASAQVEMALDRVAECTKGGVWPGISDDEVSLWLPAWADPEIGEGPDESQPIEDVSF